jgi:hypothetical protein
VSPRQEEALGARQTVDHRCLFAVQRHQIGVPGDAKTAEVADVRQRYCGLIEKDQVALRVARVGLDKQLVQPPDSQSLESAERL